MSTKPHGVVCADHNRHTCIEVGRQADKVQYVPLNIEGLELLLAPAREFDKTFSPLSDYPVEKAAKLYAEYAAIVGGTREAMQALASFTSLTPKEIEMATTKKAAPAAKPAAKPKAATKPAAKAAPKAEAEKAAKAPAAKKEPSEKKPSAASMFKELIMAGTMTDDKIFEKVQKAFELDDNKRSYVAWYRKDLEKKGMKPPAAKA